MDSFFSNSTLQFIGIQLFVGTTMVCVKKLYTIMCHIEEDKNRKFYMQYYKIGQLESELEMVKNKVSELTELCAQLQDQNASSSVSTETCSIESVPLQMPENPSLDYCIDGVFANDLWADADADAKASDSPSAKEELAELEEVMVQSGEQDEPKKEAPKYKYGLGFLIG